MEKSIDNIIPVDKTLKEYSGSDSYTIGQRTVIKIIPLMDKNRQEEGVLLAVLSGLISAAGISPKYFSDGSCKIGFGKTTRLFIGKLFKSELTLKEYETYEGVLNDIVNMAIEQ